MEVSEARHLNLIQSSFVRPRLILLFPLAAATPERVPRWAKTGYLHPIQARIALQLMIASGYGQNQTNAAFEDPIREATNQIWEY
jgi:hypothetical protein